jgi:hypothetical protein
MIYDGLLFPCPSLCISLLCVQIFKSLDVGSSGTVHFTDFMAASKFWPCVASSGFARRLLMHRCRVGTYVALSVAACPIKGSRWLVLPAWQVVGHKWPRNALVLPAHSGTHTHVCTHDYVYL